MDWKRNFYLQIRWWHLVWLLLIVLLTGFGIWSLANSGVEIRLKQVDNISGVCVARLELSSKLPFRFTIEPFFAEVWTDEILFSRFQPFDGFRQVSPDKETELLLVFNLEDISGPSAETDLQDYSIKAVIPYTVLGITRAENFRANFSFSPTGSRILPEP